MKGGAQHHLGFGIALRRRQLEPMGGLRGIAGDAPGVVMNLTEPASRGGVALGRRGLGPALRRSRSRARRLRLPDTSSSACSGHRPIRLRPPFRTSARLPRDRRRCRALRSTSAPGSAARSHRRLRPPAGTSQRRRSHRAARPSRSCRAPPGCSARAPRRARQDHARSPTPLHSPCRRTPAGPAPSRRRRRSRRTARPALLSACR